MCRLHCTQQHRQGSRDFALKPSTWPNPQGNHPNSTLALCDVAAIQSRMDSREVTTHVYALPKRESTYHRAERNASNYHMAPTPRLQSNITSTITKNSSTGRTKHSRSTICLGQVRGRAPASAAIRFELVVHVQAPDCELVRVG
jgi:hypothetical protein